MLKIRTYGIAPYSLAVVHGGPSAPGEMAPVAKKLSTLFGVLEPFQTACSVQGQIKELYNLLERYGNPPLTLIGFSWGAWLSYIFTARHQGLIKKLILISCGPFEEKDASSIMETRLSRLNEEEKKEFHFLQKAFQDSKVADKNIVFARLGELMFKADSYDPFPYENMVIRFDYQLFQQVWHDASLLRTSGELLEYGKSISCPVIAIHGSYDSHPAHAVQDSLSKVCRDFRFILIKNCGHYPWMEKLAFKEFYSLLLQEVKQ
jgi:pimeloyl-ACP methyl ester carboxylesterase